MLATIFKGTAIALVVVGVGGGVKHCVMDENPNNFSPAKKFTKGLLSTYGDIASVAKDPETQKDIREGTKSVLDTAGETLNSVLGGTADFMREQADKMEREKEQKQEATQKPDDRDTIEAAGDLPGAEYYR